MGILTPHRNRAECTEMISPADISKIVLMQSMRAGVGHIGSSLSISAILAALYGGVLKGKGPRDPDRDRFILSKGHAALALYAALHLRGWISAEELDTYCADGSLLGVHPDSELPGVDFSTGSLGHGLPLGVGAAIAARSQKSERLVFVLLSDAECDEGSLWEAVMLAAHHRLDNLVAIVDLNGQQALGYTRDVLSLDPLAEKWRAFGWDVLEVDGHDVAGLCGAMASLPSRTRAPHVLIARTVFGHGVSFMKSEIKWHYLPMSKADYDEALAEIEAMK
jgi:transketolase